ncbi:MFS family permease [Sphingobium sp. B2D3A]|uniref:MFS transporter n=1 Tax=unclassified Sphingobium TaxID=2611147 RepID=UPI002224A604|nr:MULTISPECIES: MFS transporter [unclassified Sphingobium]MCW2335771.1 MFS family permease [Sphingobium sp. B2D3A]MCW2385530.1 MFS family permease [Sphingobium sp. B2D3D]
MSTPASPSEFRHGWPVVLAAACGSGLGIAGLLTYSAGIFAKDLESAIGLSRTTLGAAFFLATVALAIALPIAGWLIDRVGPRWPAVAGSLALSGGFALLGTVVHSVAGYMSVMAGIGLLAACSSPVAYTRAVNAVFDRARGLALGLTQVGIGISAAVVPPALAIIVAERGWQAGYLALAAIAAMGVIPALSLPNLRSPRTPDRAGGMARAQMRSPLYLLVLASFGMMALSFAGLLPHFVPMLRESGLDARTAGSLAGLIGGSVIVSRVVVGWLADRVPAPRIAAACCALCALGCIALATGGATLAWVGAIALGTAMGAEADLIGYLTARYFGITHYGALYAVQYASFMLLAGLGPLWVGALADATGGYNAPLWVAAAGLGVSILLFLRLPNPQTSR